MDRSRHGMPINPTNGDNSNSNSNSNQTIESLLGGSLARLNRSGHSFAMNPNLIGTSLFEYTNCQRRQESNPSILANSIYLDFPELIMGTNQRNHTSAPGFPSADLIRIASLLQASSPRQSLCTINGPTIPPVSVQHGISPQEMASIIADFQSQGEEATRLDTNAVAALLRDLATPTLDQRTGSLLLAAASANASTSKQQYKVDVGTSRTECVPNTNGGPLVDGSASAGLPPDLRLTYGQKSHHVAGAVVDSTGVPEVDAVSLDFDIARQRKEGTTLGTPGNTDAKMRHSSITSSARSHRRSRPKHSGIPNTKSKKLEHNDDAPMAAMRSTNSNTVAPADSRNVNVEPTNPFLLPCRARGMPADHNFRNAHFVIPGNVRHGEELICSYQACRNTGIKFQYCASCRIPVAKRNFNQRHSHGLYDESVHASGEPLRDTSVVAPALVASSIAGGPNPSLCSQDLYAREKGRSAHTNLVQGDYNASATPRNALYETNDGTGGVVEALTTGVTTKVEQQSIATGTNNSDLSVKKPIPPLDVMKSRRPQLLEPIPDISMDRQLRWLSLLKTRPSINDSDLMSKWLMEVMAVSDLQRALPPTHHDASNTSSCSIGDNRIDTDEGFGDDLSEPTGSNGAITSSLASSARVEDDEGEIDQSVKQQVPTQAKQASESRKKKKRRLMNKT